MNNIELVTLFRRPYSTMSHLFLFIYLFCLCILLLHSLPPKMCQAMLLLPALRNTVRHPGCRTEISRALRKRTRYRRAPRHYTYTIEQGSICLFVRQEKVLRQAQVRELKKTLFHSTSKKKKSSFAQGGLKGRMYICVTSHTL